MDNETEGNSKANREERPARSNGIPTLREESEQVSKEITSRWKELKREGDVVTYNTGGGIFEKNLKTGRLTRVEELEAV